MRKSIWIVILTFLLIAAVVPAKQESVELICASVEITPLDSGAVRVLCQLQSLPTETVTPTVTPTLTSTSTPTATQTALPSATSTSTPVPQGFPWPMRGNLERASLPKCTFHDPIGWHSLDEVRWDLNGDGTKELVELGCYFTHTHNADPYVMESMFGDIVDVVGQEISYDWETPNENIHKHEFYKFGVRQDLPCDPNTNIDGKSPVNCVTDLLWEYHGSGNAIDVLTQVHSFFIQARVCQYPNYTNCGIIRGGGWANFGTLHVNYKEATWNRPGGTIVVDGVTYNIPAENPALKNSGFLEPYIGATRIDTALFLYQKYPNGDGLARMSIWSMAKSRKFPGYNEMLGGVFRTYDDWTGMDTANLYSWLPVCPNIDECRYNSSVHAVNELYVYVPSKLDTNGDGFVNFSGFTDLKGNIDQTCTTRSKTCVPFELENMPVGWAFFTDPGNGKNAAQEFDTSPSGLFWIEWPN